MKRLFVATVSCAVGALASALWIQNAVSQPRISTTRQIQVVGAAANNQSHGAWLVDLQSSSVIFCERTSSETRCHTMPIP
jgi:hypothetical protein